jgi:hypothetical protein
MVDFRAMHPHRRLSLAPALLCLSLAAALPARAESPARAAPEPPAAGAKQPPDVDPARIEAVVQENLANIEEVRDGLAPTMRTAATAWVAVEAILRARGRYMSDLGEVVALTRPGGLRALDRLDNAASDALGYLVTLFLEKDSAVPSAPVRRAFVEAARDVPGCPPVPIGFIILARADALAVAARNCIQANPTLPAAEIKRAAVREIAVDLANYLDAFTNEKRVQLTMEATADYTANRIRCPYDGSSYAIVSRRTGVKADDSLFRRLVCRCKECRHEVKLDFDFPKNMALPVPEAP